MIAEVGLAMLLGVIGGAINAVAGGGPIIIVAALAAAGMPADVASLTSTVALLPGQVATGWYARSSLVPVLPASGRRTLAIVASVGGAIGAALLLATPAQVFAGLLPFLIAFAVALYAWNSRPRPEPGGAPASSAMLARWLAPLAVYGGFYGGGNSFMVLALLAHARVPARTAAHAKNLLILLMNATAAAVFLASGRVDAAVALPLGAGALAGAAAGSLMIDRLDPVWLRRLVIAVGTGLAAWLALRG